MVRVGSRIKMIKRIRGWEKVNEIFEVIKINYDSSLVVKGLSGIGLISYEEYSLFFKLIENEWTEWKSVDDYTYKTNNRIVIVTKNDRTAISKCHPEDEFDLQKGIEIALARIKLSEIREQYVIALSIVNKLTQ